MDIDILHMALTGRPDDDERTVTKAIFTARVGPVQLSSCAIVRQGDGHVMAVSPQPASAHVAAPAPVVPAPAKASEPVNPWRRVIDRANSKRVEDKPKSSAWSAAVARINERLKEC